MLRHTLQLFVVSFFLLMWAALAAAQPGMSTLCKFNVGALAGQTKDYAPLPAAPVGSPCQDAGSMGVVVSKGPAAGGTSTLCQFTNGPLKGSTKDYAPMAPVPVGTPCFDGVSTGQVIAGIAPVGPGMSTICSFSIGPRAGAQQDYSSMPPAPIGVPCFDGMGSQGQVIAAAAPPTPTTGKSAICEFKSGPRSGQTQDYTPMPALPVGSPCQDGFGSQGYVVAAAVSLPIKMSRTCLYYEGLAKGHSQFFSNVSPVVIGTPCWDGGQNRGMTIEDQGGNTFMSSWNGDPSKPAVVAPPPPGALIQPIPAGPTPFQIGTNCLVGAAGNEAISAQCMAQNMPPNVVQQCSVNPASCFGQFNPATYQVMVATKAAEIIGVNVPAAAKKLDRIWGKVRGFL